jgi:hypothetical protein
MLATAKNEAIAPPVARQAPPNACLNSSPRAVPSLLQHAALASHSVASSPATCASSATASGGASSIPFFQLLTFCGAMPAALAAAA